ncbi:MAG: (2Fe-2S)-binding protein [Myxococcota bacterium]
MRRLLDIQAIINGDSVRAAISPNVTLVQLLREILDLPGTKRGCDRGECGACTVLVDGAPVLSCLMLAADVDGRRVETVEALARGPDLHPLQQAFVELGATQCGFCTPGMLMSARALLETESSPSREQIEKALGGNLCRCTGYTKIVDAVEEAARRIGKEGARHG